MMLNDDHACPGPPASDEPPAVGSIHAGVVQSVKPFGVFVAIQGYRKHVLVHHTQVVGNMLYGLSWTGCCCSAQSDHG